MSKKYPGVDVGVMILKDDKVLLGLRNSDPEKADSELHGEGTWTMPGGKVDFGEKLKEAAKRETFEENGIEIKNLKLISVTDDILKEVHFVTIGYLCEDFEGEAKVKEPEEIVKWEWFSLDEVPDNIFLPSKKILKRYKN